MIQDLMLANHKMEMSVNFRICHMAQEDVLHPPASAS